MKNTLIAIVVIIVLGAGGWYLYSTGAIKAPAGAPSGTATTTTTTVATVNGQAITYGQLTAAEAQLAAQSGTGTSSASQYQPQALDSLISLMLLQQAAGQAGFTASSTEVDAQIAAAKQQLGDQGYQQALAQQGVTEEQLRAQLGQSLAVQAYLAQKLNLPSVTATDAEVTAAYNQLKGASQGTTTPPLAQVKDQVKQLVINQKQQQLVQQLVQQLRAAANVQTFI